MLKINNNNKFVDFEEDFWAGVDNDVLKSFAQNVMHASKTSFKIEYSIWLETKNVRAKEVCEAFIQYCKQNNINLDDNFINKVKKQFIEVKQDQKENIKDNKEKISLIKWRYRHYRRKIKTFDREMQNQI